jgi:hypothetical protein
MTQTRRNLSFPPRRTGAEVRFEAVVRSGHPAQPVCPEAGLPRENAPSNAALYPEGGRGEAGSAGTHNWLTCIKDLLAASRYSTKNR